VEAERRVIDKVEIVDGLEKRKVRAPCQPPEARLLPMGDLSSVTRSVRKS